jgi:hypothetical protein
MQCSVWDVVVDGCEYYRREGACMQGSGSDAESKRANDAKGKCVCETSSGG